MIKFLISGAACVLSITASAVMAAPLPITPGSWTLAILPDTQKYAQSYPEIFNNQTQFLADYKNSLNLGFVLHEGDIVNKNLDTQWAVASNALVTLETAGVNYLLAPGNHDFGENGHMINRLSLMSDYFPVSRLDDQPTFGGVYPGEPTLTHNSYSLFSAGGTDWLALALECAPRNEIVDWADGVLKAHPDRQAIIVTHIYMYSDDTRYDWDAKGDAQEWSPQTYYNDNPEALGSVNDGEDIWQKLKDNANLKFVFNGHVLNDGTGRLESVGGNGNVVHQMLANYQFLDDGGEGYLRLLEFLPDGDTVHVRTYSPWLDAQGLNPYRTESDHDFVISLSSLTPWAPAMEHALGANLVATGPALPSSNTFDGLSVPQSGTPQVGTLQVNRGDYQISVGGEGISYDQGILLATVTQNVRDGVQATVEAGRNSFSDGFLTLSVMQAGSTSEKEANFNTSVAWFRFDAGWQGAQVRSDGVMIAANGVAQENLTKSGTYAGRYTLDLGVDSRTDGMLFAIGNNNSNKVVNTGVLADGSGWDLRVQENFPTFSQNGVDADFSFLYLPYVTENLIGGYFNGTSGSHFASVGSFAMLRLSTGQYRLTIPGETPETGMLILTTSREFTSGSVGTAPDDNFLTYEPDGLGNFLIHSYDFNGTTSMNLQDTYFVWAYIDFSDPISLSPPLHEMTWNAGHDGDWTDRTWTGFLPPPYPNGLADVIVDTPSTVTVTFDQEANSLSVSDGGQVTIRDGSSLQITTDVEVGSGGTLEINGSLTAEIINIEGTLTAGDLSLGDATLYVTNGGTVTMENLTGNGSVVVGGGSSTLTAGSISVSTLTIGASGRTAMQPPALEEGGTSSSVAPEPTSWILLLTAAGLLLARRRRNARGTSIDNAAVCRTFTTPIKG